MRQHVSMTTAALLAFVTTAVGADRYATVTPNAAAAFLSKHTGPIVDVRVAGDCPDDRRLSRSSLNIAFDGEASGDQAEMARSMFIAAIRKQPRIAAAKRSDQTVFIVCCSGTRSSRAAEALAAAGFSVAHLAGGLNDTNLPLTLLKGKRNAE